MHHLMQLVHLSDVRGHIIARRHGLLEVVLLKCAADDVAPHRAYINIGQESSRSRAGNLQAIEHRLASARSAPLG